MTGRPLPIRAALLVPLASGLVALLVWAGTAPQTPRPTGDRPARGTTDFNRPEVLAWSLELGPSTDALRDVRCRSREPHVFVCHGRSPDGTRSTIQILVNDPGTAWTTEQLPAIADRTVSMLHPPPQPRSTRP